MSAIRIEVCSCCALPEAYIADAIARIRSEHGPQVEIVTSKCLDVCQEHGAVRVGAAILTVKPGDETQLEAQVRRAVAPVR